MSRLLHYSDKPLAFDPLRVYEVGVGCYKPPGLWVSVEGEHDWPAWCRAEEFNVERLSCASEIILKPSANVLRIGTVHDLDAFAKKFRFGVRRYETEIAWNEVRYEHDGIIIVPYQWERRLAEGFSWYYGWDCASGVIWNLSAIESVKPLEIERCQFAK